MMRPPVDHRRRAPGVRRQVPHYVYRCFDSEGCLLYVGCSNAPLLRVDAHRDSWWGDGIDSVRYTVFPDREKALAVERDAIFSEGPACNVRGRWYKRDSRSAWSVDDYHQFHTAVVHAAHGVLGVHTERLLGDIEREMSARFGVTPLLKWKAA